MARKKATEVVVETKGNLTDIERRKRLDTIMAGIMKKNDGIVVGRLSDPEIKKRLKIEFIPTPSVNFNAATGGGLPKGKMCIISGSEDSGKS